MNPGFLRLLIVQHLTKESCSGYTLVKHIHEETGWKPSYGSVYPLLQNMQEDDLLTVVEDGRRKLYSLTSKGKESWRNEQAQRKQAFRTILEELHVLSSLGDAEAGNLAELIESKKLDGMPLCDIPEVVQMRHEIFRLIKDEKVEHNKKRLAEIFAATAKELRKL